MTAEPILKSPFPYFGGKSKIAAMVWERFGTIQNFVEPFFGSGAVLLGCPTPGHTETVNDIDALLANFWRAVALDPEAVATYADWPVNEVDLHARHRYLRDARGQAELFMADPEKYDAKLAGWWVWGISQWIGSGWCPPPHVGDAGMGVHRASARPSGEEWQARPFLSHDGQGVHRETLARKRPAGVRVDGSLEPRRPRLGGGGRSGGQSGVHRESLSRQTPHLQGDSGAAGMGIHASAFNMKTGGIYDYFAALSARLRRVRVCCGDWRRVLGPSVTFRHGLTAVFLDPPYAQDGRADVYGYESHIFEDVRQWAIENGDNPLLRIAICGYDFEMPEGWRGVPWKAHGGYGSQGEGRGRANAHREMVWFSSACIDPAETARTAFSRPIRIGASDFDGTMFEADE